MSGGILSGEILSGGDIVRGVYCPGDIVRGDIVLEPYVCMHLCMHACMHMYVCMYVNLYSLLRLGADHCDRRLTQTCSKSTEKATCGFHESGYIGRAQHDTFVNAFIKHSRNIQDGVPYQNSVIYISVDVCVCMYVCMYVCM